MKRHFTTNLPPPTELSGVVLEKMSQEFPNPSSPISNSQELETDPITLNRRQKQIDYGKNTEGYINYLGAISRKQRQPFHPKTPNLSRKYSRRAWDGLVKQWRLDLHCWTHMELGASANNYGQDEEDEESVPPENESFTSESESLAETGSTSSSISAAFAVVGVGVTIGEGQGGGQLGDDDVSKSSQNDSKDLDATLTEISVSVGDGKEIASIKCHGKRSKLTELNLF